MDIGSPEFWRWVWLAAAVAFGLGEMSTAGSFFLLPFAIGAAVAAILSFMGLGIGFGWAAFVLISVGAFAVLFPLGRRLDRSIPHLGIGADRLIGKQGTVTTAIPAGAATAGDVRVESEDWRARSVDGAQIRAGTTVEVVRLEGTHLIVSPLPRPARAEIPPENKES